MLHLRFIQVTFLAYYTDSRSDIALRKQEA